MKTHFSNFVNKLRNQSDALIAPAGAEQKMEVISGEELLAIRGGDKEYKPIYDEPQTHLWRKASLLFDPEG